MNSLVSRAAPFIEVEAVDFKGEFCKFSLEDTLKKSKGGVVLFFYPLDFTFVCPTELVKLSEMCGEFQKLGVTVAGINTDSKYSHKAWTEKDVSEGGVGELTYSLLSDYTKEVAREYGILLEEKGVCLRATFYIDKNGIVRHQSVNDLPIGRNISEILRIVKAWKFHEEHGDVCPVNWEAGQSGMEASDEGLQNYMTSNSSK